MPDKIRKSVLIFIFPLLLAGLPAFAEEESQPLGSCNSVQNISWLIGKWRTKAGKQTFEEEWAANPGAGLSGSARAIADDDGEISAYEQLYIDEKDGVLVYTADVKQNPEPVDFPLKDCGDDYWKFTNPEHDFPQIIRYERQKDGGFQVHVADLKDNGFTLKFQLPGSAE